MGPLRRHRCELLTLLFLVAVTAAVFWRVTAAEFVRWDDDILFFNNPHLQGLNAKSINWAFTDVQYALRYQPLVWLAWFTVFQIAGLAPHAFHLLSVAVHCLNTGLVFLCVRQLIRLSHPLSPLAPNLNLNLNLSAALGTLFWSLHPLRVEPVAWASAYLHLQALCFLLISTFAYLKAHQPNQTAKNPRWYWLAVVCFAASLLSYPIGLGMVAVFFALDYFPLRRLRLDSSLWRDSSVRRVLFEKLPFIAAAVIVLGIGILVRYGTEMNWKKPVTLTEFGAAERVMQATYIWSYYLWKPFVPSDLSPIYTTLLEFRATDAPFIVSALLLAIITIIVIWQRNRWPGALVLWIFHLALLVPMVGLTEHPHYSSDRYGLTVGIAWSILIAAGLWHLRDQAKARTTALASSGVAVAIFATLTARQVPVWNNSQALFRHTIRVLGNHPYAHDLHFRLGEMFMYQNKFADAETEYRETLRILPNHPIAHNNLGMVLLAQDKTDAAVEQFLEQLKINPNQLEAHHNLTLIYGKRGDMEKAKVHFAEVQRLKAQAVPKPSP